MMINKSVKMVPLGKNSQIKLIQPNEFKQALSPEGRINALESKVEDLRVLVTSLLKTIKNTDYEKHTVVKEDNVHNTHQQDKNEEIDNDVELNKDMIPINSVLTGIVNGIPHVLYVNRNSYSVGSKKYETLSGAAKGVTGKRRNGWEFWRLPNGTRVGDTVTVPIYKNTNS